jgi:CRISPR-associated protein Cmr3
LPLLLILAQSERGKPAGGYWLKQPGWRKYLDGETPMADDLIETGKLWQIDSRVGVGLDADTRRASDGKLFTVQAVAMCPDTGFVVGISGARPPADGLLRLGGDGRAAALHPASVEPPRPDYEAIARSGRCRIVLTTPGLFPQGWKLPGTDPDNRISFADIRARLVCAAVSRAEVISGWDLAKNRPKAAQRVAPAGSVYWLDDLDATEETLRKLAETGLWINSDDNPSRRVEGFNRFQFAAY